MMKTNNSHGLLSVALAALLCFAFTRSTMAEVQVAKPNDVVTPGVKADATAVYDDWMLTSGKAEETLQFTGLDAGTGYTLEMEFLAYFVKYAGSKCTIGRVSAGDVELAREVVIPTTIGNNPLPPALRQPIPATAIHDGQVTVRLERIEALQPVKKTAQKEFVPQVITNGAAGAVKKNETEVVSPNPFAVHVRLVAAEPSARAVTVVLPHPIEVPVVRLTPRPVVLPGVAPLQVDLGGTWQASREPSPGFWKQTELSGGNWKPVQVPGELAMQGLEVIPGTTAAYYREYESPRLLPGNPKTMPAAAYWREFECPLAWQGQRIKLKCDAIYNAARIWINGVEVGGHVGDFTPFDLDITAAVNPGGRNVIAVSVRVDKMADDIPAVSWFIARYPAGILRKIYLFPVPAVNISGVYVLTDFDSDYRNGVLTAKVEVRNESAQTARGLQLQLGLRQRGQSQDAREPVTASVSDVPAGESVVQVVQVDVREPKKWDVEHPNLYDLSVALLAGGKESERVSERIGFRKIEIRGPQVFINNRPVRYHGVVWHESDPLRGRVLSGGDWRRDMQLLRDMNCNYIRFQCVGGPPAEELVEACDEVGVFLEDELPYCWSRLGVEALPFTLRSTVEMVMRDRSRPSVVQWSLGNETDVDHNLLIAHRLAMLPLDSSRPVLSDGQGWQMPILNFHYTEFPRCAGTSTKVPHMQGEWGHVMSYNCREVYTDPGVRDIWAYGIADKWEKMCALKACLGGSIWTGIDDFWLMPDGTVCGWGEYGFVDIWRRLKPEYWHFKKVFSPIHITTTALSMPAAGQPLRIPVENRYAFSDLREVRFDWTLNKQAGNASTALAPGEKGLLDIPCPAGLSAGMLELKGFNAEGVMVDAWRIAVGNPTEKTVPSPAPQKVEWIKGTDHHLIRCGATSWKLDVHSGMIVEVTRGAETLPLTGPTLMVLPLSGERYALLRGGRNVGFTTSLIQKSGTEAWFKAPTPLTATCSGWQVKAVNVQKVGEAVEVTVTGDYAEATGQFILRFTPEGECHAAYDFALTDGLAWTSEDEPPRRVKIQKGAITPRQLGLVFDLPKACDTLSWRRKAQWTWYPEDHIGRPEGTAKAFPGTPLCAETPFYKTKPTWLWSQDTTPQGSADFRSTKANIYEASLTAADGMGLRVVSDGNQHVRAWADGAINRLLVSDVNCEGCLDYFYECRVLPSPVFKPGDHAKGVVRVTFE